MRYILFTTILLLCFYSCGRNIIEHSDIKSDGFITKDCFQTIIKSKPDKNLIGLVQNRESALKNVKKIMDDTVNTKLMEYYSSYLKIKNSNIDINKYQPRVMEELKKFKKWGYLAHQYYEEDMSAVMVFRIYKKKLKEKIESINIEKIIKEKNSGKGEKK